MLAVAPSTVGGSPHQKASGAASRNTSRPATAGGKVFQCTGFGRCNQIFSRHEHLQRHIRKHTGEKPFVCICGRMFSRMDNLRQHAQTIHRAVDNNLIDLRTASFANHPLLPPGRSGCQLSANGSQMMVPFPGPGPQFNGTSMLASYSNPWSGADGQRRHLHPSQSSGLPPWQQVSNANMSAAVAESHARSPISKINDSVNVVGSSEFLGPSSAHSFGGYSATRSVAPHSEYARLETSSMQPNVGNGRTEVPQWLMPPRQLSPGTWVNGPATGLDYHSARPEWPAGVDQASSLAKVEGIRKASRPENVIIPSLGHPNIASTMLPTPGIEVNTFPRYPAGAERSIQEMQPDLSTSTGARTSVSTRYMALPSPSSLPPSLASASSLSERRSSNQSMDSETSTENIRRVSIAELCTEKDLQRAC